MKPMSDGYQSKLKLKGNGILTGKYEMEVEIGDDSLPWDTPIIRAFLEDDNLMEMTIISTCIGFIKTLTKQFAT